MDSELKQRSLALNILEPCILVAITMVCLIGNSLTCIAVYRNARLRTSTNLYLISLAVGDIIHAAIVMPLTVGVLIAGELSYGETVCDLFALFTQFSVYVSPTTMGLTAFNRYVRIVKPQHYSRIFTDARSKIYVAAVWLTIVGYISICKMAGFTEKSFFAGHAVCIFVQTTVAIEIIHYIVVVLFFFSSSTRSCISFLLQGLQRNKTSQSKHGFNSPSRRQWKSIDSQRDQDYQIACHCYVHLCIMLGPILDHCGYRALHCCRSA